MLSKLQLVLLCTMFMVGQLYAQIIPYQLTPDWESQALGKYSTGLDLVDINNDGYLDLVIANGNDMAQQRLEVYYNNGNGTFPNTPQWQSDDIDYNCKLACGDINKDGWLDVAVSVYTGDGGFGDKGKVKVYYNNAGQLESLPSFESIPMFTFSCALGDADGDGDLDLAVACGEPYSKITDYLKIFINNDGTFTETPQWQSTNTLGGMDVNFADFDNNGFLDVFVGSATSPSCLYLADNKGSINKTPAWQSTEIINGNTLDIGYSNDSKPYVVLTNNNQMGGNGINMMYSFDVPIPVNSSAVWQSEQFKYSSGMTLADVNKDDTLDLIFGGWWGPMRIALGNRNGFNLSSDYTSNTKSVVEEIVTADLANDNLLIEIDTIEIQNNYAKCIYLSKQKIQSISSITLNGVLVQSNDYAWILGRNWISFADSLKQNDILIVEYMHTLSPDIVITNWDTSKGNYIFYNNSSSSIAENKDMIAFNIYPNPTSSQITIQNLNNQIAQYDLELINTKGDKVLSKKIEFIGSYKLNLESLHSGIYFLTLHNDKESIVKKIILNK